MKNVFFLLLTSISTSVLANKTPTISCTVSPLNITIYDDNSGVATYKDLDYEDKAEAYEYIQPNYAGTGECSYRWWILSYQGVAYQVSEHGCSSSHYNIPDSSVGELRVNGKLNKHTGGQFYMDGGVMFWCEK